MTEWASRTISLPGAFGRAGSTMRLRNGAGRYTQAGGHRRAARVCSLPLWSLLRAGVPSPIQPRQ